MVWGHAVWCSEPTLSRYSHRIWTREKHGWSSASEELNLGAIKTDWKKEDWRCEIQLGIKEVMQKITRVKIKSEGPF